MTFSGRRPPSPSSISVVSTRGKAARVPIASSQPVISPAWAATASPRSMAAARSRLKPSVRSAIRSRSLSGSQRITRSGRNQSQTLPSRSVSTGSQTRIRRKGSPFSRFSASWRRRLSRMSAAFSAASRQAFSRAFGARAVSKYSASSSSSSGSGGRESSSPPAGGSGAAFSPSASRIRRAASGYSASASSASQAGVSTASSSASWLRWLIQSKPRRPSTSSSKNSSRIPWLRAGG